MKFMKTINEMQAVVTKLRREVQRSEAPKAGDTLEDQIRRRNKAIVDGYANKLDQEMMNELKTAGKCTCVSGVVGDDCPVHGKAGECICQPATMYPPGGLADDPGSINVDCPIHGKHTWAGGSRPIDKPTKEHILIPDLPLHVRVAKELGKQIRYAEDEWQEYFEDIDAWLPVPGRDKNVGSAMGALEEYVGKNRNYNICYYPDFEKRFHISIWDLTFKRDLHACVKGNILPQAICEAIVAHAEGK